MNLERAGGENIEGAGRKTIIDYHASGQTGTENYHQLSRRI